MKDTIEILKTYNHFMGVDVGKGALSVHHHTHGAWGDIPNTTEGIAKFLAEKEEFLAGAYVVVDTTGGWELPLIAALLGKGIAVHRADGRKVKSFARSFGTLAKTDAIDAKILARYGHDRHPELVLCELANDAQRLLKSLVTRRGQIATMLKEERQRHSAPLPQKVCLLVENMITVLEEHLETIELQIKTCIEEDKMLQQKSAVLLEMEGVGSVTSAFLLAEMPELGQLGRKEIAALAGLAPHAYDSGKMHGRRTTYGGRPAVKHVLFIAAMAAARKKDSPLRAFYLKLVAAGKSKRCALVATARKLITILNARLKEKFFVQPKLMSR